MIINHNMGAMNANRNMGINSAKANKSMEKLSSGLRINKAGDDAAGLAISEKMRGQIRGLDQASANSQDGISMVQTAEGALSETQSILQRMRELAVQGANDTNVEVDRSEIQKEMNQLSSEINRIGNTTEFNTKALLSGDGKESIKSTGITGVSGKLGVAATGTEGADASKTQAINANKVAGDVTALSNSDTVTYTVNGQDLVATFITADTAKGTGGEAFAVDEDSASINLGAGFSNDSDGVTAVANGIKDALQGMIDANDTLKGQYKVSVQGSADTVVIEAIEGSSFDGAAGSIGVASSLSTATFADDSSITDVGINVSADAATKDIDLASYDTKAAVEGLVGKGMTINDTQVEFYDASKGAYTGAAKGVDLSFAINSGGTIENDLASTLATQLGTIDGIDATAGSATLTITAATAGAAGNDIEVSDGGIQKSFEATLQVGANMGQGFVVDINDMRAAALTVTGTAGAEATDGAKYTDSNSVTNGTDSTLREAALDISSYDNATAAVEVINNAIESVSSERSKLGAVSNRLEHTIANLGTSSENLTSAESRIRDVDMAKEMSTFSKNNILNQAAQAMLAQANQQPQQVLSLLR
jgi:flagellin